MYFKIHFFSIFVFINLCILLIVAEEPEIDEENIPVIEGHGGTVNILEEADVLVLTTDNFVHVTSINSVLLVEFYAPWCGHCKSLEPEYASAANKLKEDNIRIAKIDATEHEALAKEYKVTGFPTIKLFRNGVDSEDYEGDRTSTGIIQYMKRQADPNYQPPPSFVKVLTNSNFSNFIDNEKLSLVEFYAPWCGHCKKLAPEYEGAAEDLATEVIPLAKVDGTVEKETAKQYGVTGYPKLLVFREGIEFEFKGPRTREGIVVYMKKMAQLPSKLITSALEAKNNVPRNDPCIFAYLDSQHDNFDKYIDAANHIRDDYTFFHTSDAELAAKYKLSKNTVNIIFPEIYHSSFEPKKLEYNQPEIESEFLLEWIKHNIVPLVGQRTRVNKDIQYRRKPLVVVYYEVSFKHQNIKATQIIRNKILPVAAKFKDMTFAISNEETFQDDLKAFGLEDSGEDVNVGIFADDNLKFAMEPEDDFDAHQLQKYIMKFREGKLRPHLKSQHIPKKNTGPVKVVVAKTFERDVLMTDKNVMIEFYAPWCGHCKKLEPEYKKLGKYFAKKNSEVVIAKMDATANDVHPYLKVEGFPTIYFLKADDKENPVKYNEADRSFEGLRDFINKELGTSEEKDEL